MNSPDPLRGPTAIWCRRGCLFGAALAVAGPASLDAQQHAEVTFYHASGNQSKVLFVDAGRGRQPSTSSTQTLALPQGSNVCVRLPNQHPVNYKYALQVEVDSSEIRLPDLAGITAALTQLAGSQTRVGLALTTDPVDFYLEAVLPLRRDLERAEGALDASDAAESQSEVTERTEDTSRGFIHARTVIRDLSEDPGRFQDTTLESFLKTALDSARALGANDTEHDLLETYGEALLSTRNSLRPIGEAAVERVLCHTLGQYPTVLRLNISKVGARSAKAGRDVGESLVEIRVDPYFGRAVVEVIPTLFLGLPIETADRFFIEADTLRRSDRAQRLDAQVRGGLMLLLNGPTFGRSRDMALGFAFGFGFLGGEENPISDIAGAAVLSWRNLVRLGFGAGKSMIPEARLREGVPGLQVDMPIPDGMEIDQVLESQSLWSFYIIASISGFELSKKQ